jgi:F-type H+-transporting ATPase subunit gamma
MAKARAIVKRRKAVRNIRKITRTMELIATARFKRAMDRATEAAAYTDKIAEIVADLSQGSLQISHPLLQSRDTVENSVLLILTSNRGLCGGYNGGVLRKAQACIRETESNLKIEVSGKRGINFLKFKGLTPEHSYTHFEEKPSFEEVEVLADRYIEQFISGKIDRLDVAYMKFESSSRQKPVLQRLLPIGQLAGSESSQGAGANIDYEFLPSAEEILEEIVPASFKAQLLKCFLDAAVSEQIFRMVAMKGATENADDMISSLSRRYNRARQSQITNELAEIIGGMSALE